jgi:hypothetical protein
MAVKWWEWWKVLPDDERQQWRLDPSASVGPLRFDSSPGEVSRALSSVTDDSQVDAHGRDVGKAASVIEEGTYREFGLHLYYREERLAAVVVNARLGPQVFADGVALVGRVPSVLERWLLDRGEAGPPGDECTYMGAGIPGSESLGAWIDVQRAGDHLLTRPVFVSRETMDDLSHFLPRHAWSACDPH